MHAGKWIELRKDNGCYELMPAPPGSRIQCAAQIHFTHLAFDFNDERLAAVDSKDNLYCVDLSNVPLCYQQLGPIGHATFLAFNPIHKCEILFGLPSGVIKFYDIDKRTHRNYSLTGHSFLPISISFYNHYALTYSCREVMIWQLQLHNKSYQLETNIENTTIKHACISSLGHVIVLYHNDTMQVWMLPHLSDVIKIDLKTLGMQRIGDFKSSMNGRALIIVSRQTEIFILNTHNWALSEHIILPTNSVRIKHLDIVPSQFVDEGNNLIAILSTKGQLHFFDIISSGFIKAFEDVNIWKKCIVSSTGSYVSGINKAGGLKLMPLNKLIAGKTSLERSKSPLKWQHSINDHLQCIRQSIKEELRPECLTRILEMFGKYPEKYRTIIWTTILKLPYNRKAYNGLTNKIRNGNVALQLVEEYCLANKSKTSLLVTILECLMEWCPFLTKVKFLPQLVFPFLMVFQKNPLLAFELVISILFNYCQNWFEYHPLPALNTLGIIENILLEVDSSLISIFCEHNFTSSDYAWPLMQSFMSEVLSASEWLILWDHLISYQRPCLFLLCIVAYNVSLKDTIISMIHSKEDFRKLYSMPGCVRAKDLLKVATNLELEIPRHMHPSYYFRNTCIKLPSKGPYPPFTLQEYPYYFTEDAHLLQIDKSMKSEHVHPEPEYHTVNDTEENRVCTKLKSAKNAQKAYFNEAQKYSEQVCDINKQLHILRKSRYKASDLSLIEADRQQNSRSVTQGEASEKYKNLQHDVNELENEVQLFIESLKYQRLGDL